MFSPAPCVQQTCTNYRTLLDGTVPGRYPLNQLVTKLGRHAHGLPVLAGKARSMDDAPQHLRGVAWAALAAEERVQVRKARAPGY